MFRTLKKRGRKAGTTYRAVPLPVNFVDELDLIHHSRGQGKADAKTMLWPWSRATAWCRVKAVMATVSIEGAQASPKGLRHGFGVVHAMHKTPLNTLQRWMGHSSPNATAIYMQAVGDEARQLAGATW